MRFNIPAVTAFLASISAISASPISDRDTNDSKNFKLLVTQSDDSVETTYLKSDGGVTLDQSEAGIYTLNLTTSTLSVLNTEIGVIAGENFTVFSPYDAVNLITTSFYVTNNPKNSWLVWSSPNFTYAQDNVALFGVGASGEPSEVLVYAFLNGYIPTGYNQTWLTVETVVVN